MLASEIAAGNSSGAGGMLLVARHLTDILIEGGARDLEHLANRRDRRLLAVVERAGHGHLLRVAERRRFRPSTLAAAGPCGVEACPRAFADEVAFKLRQGAEAGRPPFGRGSAISGGR